MKIRRVFTTRKAAVQERLGIRPGWQYWAETETIWARGNSAAQALANYSRAKNSKLHWWLDR